MEQKNNLGDTGAAEATPRETAALQGIGAAVHSAEAAASGPTTFDPAASSGGGAGTPLPHSDFNPQEAGHWRTFVEFTGTGKELFGILLQNFIFSLFTLGIYSFWGKTRKREYLWRHTQVLGSPLVYTGTGKELFVSFLIVMPVFLALSFLLSFLAQTEFAALGVLFFYLGLLYFWQFASYRALRYRLTRTRWRGIRGNLGGSALAYAWRGTLYWLAILFSFGLLLPWASARMAALKFNNVWFGDRALVFSGPARELYRAYFTMVAAIMFSLAALGGVVYLFILHVMPLGYGTGESSPLLPAGALAFYLALLILLTLCSSFYRAAFFRWFIGHMRFGELRPRSTLAGSRFFLVILGNIGIAISTLGFGLAWIIIRAAKVHLNSLEYTGDPQLDQLLQDDKTAPKRGEGLLEALDMDLDIGF